MPVERSNSPPIISKPTGTDMIPKKADCWVHEASAGLSEPQMVGGGVQEREDQEDGHRSHQSTELWALQGPGEATDTD